MLQGILSLPHAVCSLSQGLNYVYVCTCVCVHTHTYHNTYVFKRLILGSSTKEKKNNHQQIRQKSSRKFQEPCFQFLFLTPLCVLRMVINGGTCCVFISSGFQNLGLAISLLPITFLL